MAEIVTSLGITGSYDDSGIKASLLYSDGCIIVERLGSLFFPYSSELKRKISSARSELFRLYNYRSYIPINKSKLLRRMTMVSSKREEIQKLSEDITEWSIQVIKTLAKREPRSISVIGFNGHPIFYKGKGEKSLAIAHSLGLPSIVAERVKCTTVYDFMDVDIENGGNGLPLSPVYYKALLHHSACRAMISDKQKVAVINVSGMSNVTILNHRNIPESFDAGPGTALVNEYVQRFFQQSHDNEGILAARGDIIEEMLTKWMQKNILQSNTRFFEYKHFADCLAQAVRELIPIDCVATLVAFTAMTIVEGIKHHEEIGTIILTGQWNKNDFFKTLLGRSYNVITSEQLNWDNYFMESEQYAFYATRSLFMLPSSFPSTTGVSRPVHCGRLTIPVSFCKEAEQSGKSPQATSQAKASKPANQAKIAIKG
ncbi:MAG: anhydro-N-acetylmuramic acid kinase [Holosporales bacterium]|nr:anhydro-N-acetylmuramic acid kinase [Holosporales bacterium]